MLKDFYHILGVEKTASTAEIRKAYRQLAKDLHPDVNKSPKAASAFHEINEAYVILINEESRRVYDEGDQVKKPSFSEEELRDILRRQSNSFASEFRYQWRNDHYPPTNYKANEKAATFINIIMMCFALSFIIDFFVSEELGVFKVETITQKIKLTGKESDAEKYLLTTEEGYLELSFYELNEIGFPPKNAQIRKSIIYGNLSFRFNPEMKYFRNYHWALVTYFFVFIVFTSGSTGLLPKLSPERKYNAAIISTFFSIVILGLLFLG